jgi:hypothetical protein
MQKGGAGCRAVVSLTNQGMDFPDLNFYPQIFTIFHLDDGISYFRKSTGIDKI